jgi:hypothetical protein
MAKAKTIIIESVKHGVINEVPEYQGKKMIESGDYKEHKPKKEKK